MGHHGLSQAFKSFESFQSNSYINLSIHHVSLPSNDISSDNSFINSVNAISGESSNLTTVVPPVDSPDYLVKTGDSFAHSPSTSDSLNILYR